jgi:hypothetical protein
MSRSAPTQAAESSAAASSVNYESPAVVELEIEGVDFRVDAGKQGTALCISQRQSGTWDWSYCGEAKWDGSSLRSKALERRVLGPLSAALVQALVNVD